MKTGVLNHQLFCLPQGFLVVLVAIGIWGTASTADAQNAVIVDRYGALHDSEIEVVRQPPAFDAVYQELTRETDLFRQRLADTGTDASNQFSLVAQTSEPPAVPVPPSEQTTTNPTNQMSPSAPRESATTPDGSSRTSLSARPSATENRSNRSASAASRRPVRLARAPNMFGDFFSGGPIFLFATPIIDTDGEGPSVSSVEGEVQLPLAFGGRRLKIGENNGMLPQHRVYLTYNHFDNAVNSTFGDPGASGFQRRSSSLDVWTFGTEKTFGQNDEWSLEFRLPLYQSMTSSGEMEESYGSTDFAVSNGHVGNLGLILKHVLYRNQQTLWAAGLGLDIPTAEDVVIRTGNLTTELKNQTVDMAPWIGFASTPSDRSFVQLIGQMNVPLNGNDVNYNVPEDPDYYYGMPADSGSFGKYTQQTLLSFDLNTGYWLYRSPAVRGVTGIAAIAELHYTTTLNDSDTVSGHAGGFGYIDDSDTSVSLSQTGGRQDILNMTLGFHTTINNSISIRFGQVIPLRNQFDKPFSTESQAQINIVF